jgi:hypothetical protein
LWQFVNNGLGVFLGKQWTGSFGFDDIPQESGWLEVITEDGNNAIANYPEYTMPTKLPEWVNGYNPSTHTGIFNGYSDYEPRYLLGDGTPSVGPYTLQEALFIYSCMKRYVCNEGTNGYNQDSEFYSYEYNESDPRYLFISSHRNNRFSVLDQYSVINSPLTNSSNNEVFIAVDVDSLNNYYLVGRLAMYQYYFAIGNSGEGISYYVTGYDDGSSGARLFLHPQKNNGELGVGYSNITCPATLTVGSISKNYTLHGYQGPPMENFETEDEEDTIPVVPPTSLSFSATEFWPYKNAAGQPVYNTTTGAVINPPIP